MPAIHSMSGKIVSIQAGRIQRMVMPWSTQDGVAGIRFAISGIYKSQVTGPVRVSTGGLDEDQQADLENHGGPDNVILAYDADHYPVWRRELNMQDMAYGSFGENFTVSGFSDDTVCIGDIWRVGDSLLLQVTARGQPCYKLARRLKCVPQIVQPRAGTHWGGWYLRVLDEGTAQAG